MRGKNQALMIWLLGGVVWCSLKLDREIESGVMHETKKKRLHGYYETGDYDNQTTITMLRTQRRARPGTKCYAIFCLLSCQCGCFWNVGLEFDTFFSVEL